MSKKTNCIKILKPFTVRGKKGVAEGVLVLMIAGMVALLVLLLVTGSFGKLFKSILGKNECQMEFLISSFTKAGGLQTTEPSCEPHLITITMENLTKNDKKIQSNLEKYSKIYVTEKGIESAKTYVSYFKDSKRPEWAMDEIIAKEMKYCWDIAGRGRLDLFNSWWSLIDCRKKDCNTDGPECFEKCTKEQFYGIYGISSDGTATAALAGLTAAWTVGGWKTKSAVAMIGGLPIAYGLVSGKVEAAKPPTFCVLCSRIKFDDAVKTSFQNKEITSMGSWLANNPVTDIGDYSKVPYAAYLQNDDYKGIWASKDSYSYRTDQAYAVLYARINVFKAKSMLESIGTMVIGADEKDLPQAIQMIKLVQYQNIKNECDYLVG